MSMTPVFNNPITDFLNLCLPQYMLKSGDNLCAKIELKFADCMEAYGPLKARQKCAELLYDLSECNTSVAQKRRAMFIREERMRQYRQGKLSKPFEEHPPLDSFLGLPE